MKVDTSTLPSNGAFTGASYIDILPITYSKLSEYEDEPASNTIQKILRDIKYFIEPIECWRDLLLFDLDALIFTSKYISVTSKPSINLRFRCPDCGEFERDLSIGSLKFTSLRPEDLKLKSVELRGTEFNLNLKTTIGAFYELLLELNKWDLKLTKSDLVLMAVLSTANTRNQVYEAITKATGEDIEVIKYLTSGRLISSAEFNVNCSKCGKELVVRVDNLITDLFRCIHSNSDISHKINYYK